MMDANAILPPLRQDLEILKAAPDRSGAPSWVIHDPLQHRYFQIDWATRQVLKCWRPGCSLQEMAQIADEDAGVNLSDADMAAVLEFVRTNGLTDENHPESWRLLAARATSQRASRYRTAVFKLLFFRIPLVKPERALRALLPLIEPLFSRLAAGIILSITLTGLYLASRQWDSFVGTFHQFYSLTGALYFGLSLFFLKAMHELGHAFTATRYGCRVPSMGIAFMVMTPMLYTDVTDSWRLTSRKQRMAISAAGIIVEMMLAGIATFLWAFLDDGTARSIAFVVATSGWLMSLAMNINPLMRYDGYYLLSDLIGFDNLQPRAFAMGRWKLRQMLLAPTLLPPENVSPAMRRFLVGYAVASWAYRIVIFTGIAYVVYHFGIKLVGIALFLLELWLLLLWPVARELKQWREIDRSHLSTGRITAAGTIAVLLVGLFVIPWSTRVAVPAVLVASDLKQIYPARPARIVEVNARRNFPIKRGERLLTLEVPQIESEIEEARIKRNLTRQRLARAIADHTDLQQSIVLQQQLAALQSKLEGLEAERRELDIRSPLTGIVLQTASDLHPGRWIGRKELLALVASGRQAVVRGYVSGRDVQRLSLPAGGRFIPDDLTRSPFRVRLRSIADVGAAAVDIPELSSTHGGRIAAQPDADGRPVPTSAQFLLQLEPIGLTNPPGQVVRGLVYLRGTSQSIAARIWQQITKVLVRESGF